MNSIVKRVFKVKHRSRRSPKSFLPPEIWQQIIEEAIRPKQLQLFEFGLHPHEVSLVTIALGHYIGYSYDSFTTSFQESIISIRLVCRQWNELTTFVSKKWSITVLPRDNDMEVSLRATLVDIDYASEYDLQLHLLKFNPEQISVLYLRGRRDLRKVFLGSEDFARFSHLRAIHLNNKTGAESLFSMLKSIEEGIPRLELLSVFVPEFRPYDVHFAGASFPLLRTLIIRAYSVNDWPTKDWELPSISQLSMTSSDDQLANFPPLSLLYSQQLLSLNIDPWPSEDRIDFWETFPSLISVSGDIHKIPLKTSPLHPLQHLDQYEWFHDRESQYCTRFEEHIESSFNAGGAGIKSIILPFHGGFDWDSVRNGEISTVLAFGKYCSKRGVRIYSDTGEIVFSVKDEIKRALSKRRRSELILKKMIKLQIP